MRVSLLKIIIYTLYCPVSFLYWWIVKSVIRVWGEDGLHLVSVGEFVTSGWKVRSLYRETMILKAIPLFVDFRGKSCLDLACNDGFWAFRLSRFGIDRLVGVDKQKMAVFRANFLKTVYNFPSFHFKLQDIFQFLYQDHTETYDIILLLSIIYHLPEQNDWNKFFKAICQINNECLIIDTRWFDDDEYWYDKTSRQQAIIHTKQGIIKKWRPTRKEVFTLLYENGYEEIIELNPSSFLDDPKEAFGNGDPYTFQNVSDYITNHRSIVIVYKKRSKASDIRDRLDAVLSGCKLIDRYDVTMLQIKN